MIPPRAHVVASCLVLAATFACGQCARETREQPRSNDAGLISGWVLDERGPVFGAEVRLLSLTAPRCPCFAETTDSGTRATASCHCAEDLVQRVERARACRWPQPAVAQTLSAHGGRFELEQVPGANTIEVISPDAVMWMPLPEEARDIALELRRRGRPHVSLVDPDGGTIEAESIRGAFLFEDGHCVPIVSSDGGVVAAAPLPELRGELVVEAPGWEPTSEYWRGDDAPPVVLPPARDAVELKAWAERRIWSRGVRGTSPITIPEPDMLAYCALVLEVVDPRGIPIPDARVIQEPPPTAGFRTLCTGKTDASGRACVGENWYANYRAGQLNTWIGASPREGCKGGDVLRIEAPLKLGGKCAGFTRATLVSGAQVTRATLKVRRVTRTMWSGRVVSAEGHPVAAARIAFGPLQLPTGCKTRVDGRPIKTAADGTFTLGDVPRGRTTLTVKHPWYAEEVFAVDLADPPSDLVLRAPRSPRNSTTDFR